MNELPLIRTDLLISGPLYVGVYRAASQEVEIIESGRGPYYGITWSQSEVFLLARNGGAGDLVIVLDGNLCERRFIEIGRPIDGHQILYDNGRIYVTATAENAILILDPQSGQSTIWNWTGFDYDSNHINGITVDQQDDFLVSFDNHFGNVSEIARISLREGGEVERFAVGRSDQGTHNIENGLVTASGVISSLYNISDSLSEPVFEKSGRFFRGLSRSRLLSGVEVVLIGSSMLLERDLRGTPHDAIIHVLRRDDFGEIGTLAVPEIGQIHELRSLGQLTHHGISFPGHHSVIG